MISLIALILIAAGFYALVCACSPYGACHRCHGFGFATRTDLRGHLKRGKTCRRCKGSGLRIRTGRRLYHATRRH